MSESWLYRSIKSLLMGVAVSRMTFLRAPSRPPAAVRTQVYIKALYEYFKDELGETQPQATRSAIELAEFQEDAVKKARRILSRFDGVMIADSVGLGKTWI